MLLTGFFSFALCAYADGPDKIKMAKARLKYNEQSYDAALKIYRELAEKFPNDAELNYNIAECYIQLKDDENVVLYLEKAKGTDDKVNKMLYFQLGRAYQETGKAEEAVKAYEAFYNVKGINKDDAEQAIFYKKQCQTAIELTKTPVNVRIANLGDKINSTHNDYHPSITADGKTMIFTSRRGGSDPKNQKKDPGDNEFYEDIFIAHYNDTTREWEAAESIPGGLNTDGHDAAFSITADGHRILSYKNESGNGGDIYLSKSNKNGKWSPAKPLPKPINTGYWESYACLSADGNQLFFVSERKGGYGHGDIYVSKKEGRDAWSKPENLGAKVNSPEDEVGVFLHPNGKTLFFSSKRSNSMGGYDIFKTNFDGFEWSSPINLGYPINTTGDEVDFILSTNGQTGYFVSKREGTLGGFDIFKVDLTNYNVMGNEKASKAIPVGLSILKGTVIDKDANTIYGAVVKVLDETGKLVTYTESNEEGNYFLTVDGDRTYTITIQLAGFNDFSEKVYVTKDASGTQTVSKALVLERK
jgi:Tol biopolymer transport system component